VTPVHVAVPAVRVRRRAVGAAGKAARRQAILAAAKETFSEAGYHDTGMADVARAAGISYGALYWYFESKDELFHALMDAEAAALRTHIAGALDVAAGPATPAPGEAPIGADLLLRAAVRATFEFFESDRAAVRLVFRDSYALGGRFERHLFGIYEEFIADLRATFTGARQRGEIVDFPPEVAAYCVAALIGQLALRRLTTDDGLAAPVVAELVVRLVLDGLRPRPGDPDDPSRPGALSRPGAPSGPRPGDPAPVGHTPSGYDEGKRE